MSTVGQRLCADAERGEALERCWCGNLRPAKREHGWEKPGPRACNLPPRGWYCTRDAGHEGPCAALQVPSNGGQ